MERKRINTDDEPDIVELRRFLRIERDDLDECIVEQPEIFEKVARFASFAVADAEQAKSSIEDIRAELGEQFRDDAAKKDEKLTEGKLQEKIRLAPVMADAEKKYRDARRDAGEWQALKEGFVDRSFMMRELNRARIARDFDEGLTNSSVRQDTDRRATTVNKEAGEIRRERRGNWRTEKKD